jgi:starch-binding outer membrane protein, SusD/RagB family
MKHKINLFKTTVILISCFAISNACNEKNLDLKPYGATEETYFETEIQFNEGVLGTYSKLVYFYNYRAFNFLHDVRLLADDDLTTTAGNAFETFSGLNSDNGKVYDEFKFLYQVISRANSILDQLDRKGADVYSNETLMGNHKGELLFLRAFANFQLSNLFATAPLVTDRLTSENTSSVKFPSSSTGTQLLDQAIQDLTNASTILPVAWSAAEMGRITQGGAYALLGKCLVFRATLKNNVTDYQAAIAAFDNVTGFSLVSNYGDNFKTKSENNSESLFEIQLGKCAIMCNVWLATDDFSGNGDVSGYWGMFDNHWSMFGNPPFVPTQSLLNAFDAQDPRYSFSVSGAGAGVQKYVEGYGGDPKTANGVAYFNNARVLRLADVKLMKAEALVQSGGSTSEAIALINEIRSRARNSASPASVFPADLTTSETNRTTIMKWIIEERRIELAFEEGHRWFDLRRWHIGGVLQDVYGVDLATWNFSSLRPDFDFSITKNLNLPIPTGELLLNANLQQNDGWDE